VQDRIQNSNTNVKHKFKLILIFLKSILLPQRVSLKVPIFASLMAKDKKQPKIEIIKRKAKFEYHFELVLEAGVVLTGTEIKSIKKGEANMSDAYCYFRKGELWIKSLFIAEFKYGNQNNHEERRLRKLKLKSHSPRVRILTINAILSRIRIPRENWIE